jgi:hypothetical protein
MMTAITTVVMMMMMMMMMRRRRRRRMTTTPTTTTTTTTTMMMTTTKTMTKMTYILPKILTISFFFCVQDYDRDLFQFSLFYVYYALVLVQLVLHSFAEKLVPTGYQLIGEVRNVLL